MRDLIAQWRAEAADCRNQMKYPCGENTRTRIKKATAQALEFCALQLEEVLEKPVEPKALKEKAA